MSSEYSLISNGGKLLPDKVPTLSIRLNASDEDGSDEVEESSGFTSPVSESNSKATLSAMTESITTMNIATVDSVSETDEDGSCKTTFSDRMTPNSLLSAQPSEAELAYAPVCYTSYTHNEITQTHPSYDMTALPVTYIREGYTTDIAGNVYAVQYVTTDPLCSEQNVAKLEHQKMAAPRCWVDMYPHSAEMYHYADPVMGQTKLPINNHDVVYYPQPIPEPEPVRTTNSRIPELVCTNEEGYQQLKNNVTDDVSSFPALYVSVSGLLTVFMREGITVEITLDHAIRVLTDQPRMAMSISGRGSEACIVLKGVRIYQKSTTTEASLFKQRKALFTTDNVYFADRSACYRVQGKDLFVTSRDVFNDISSDISMEILNSSKCHGPSLIQQYTEIAQSAKYVYHRNGGVTVHVNGTQIYQDPQGDVEVSNRMKFIRVSPKKDSIVLETNWVEMVLDQKSIVKVKRGSHHLFASKNNFQISANGMEAGLDQSHHAYIRPQQHPYLSAINHNHYPFPR